MNEKTNEWMDEWTDGCMGGCLEQVGGRRVARWVDGQKSEVSEQVGKGGRMDGWPGGQVGGWIRWGVDGWTEE